MSMSRGFDIFQNLKKTITNNMIIFKIIMNLFQNVNKFGLEKSLLFI